MLALVDKYSHFVIPSSATSSTPRPAKSTVVLTGATGSLGAQLLAALLAKDSVEKVYVLVRASNDVDAVRRVESSLKEKGLPGIGDPRIVSLASDFAQGRLGLSQPTYDEIASSVTLVLHVSLFPIILKFD